MKVLAKKIKCAGIMAEKRIFRLTSLWALIPIIALVELYLSWSIPRKEPGADDWRAAANAIARDKKKEDDLVVIAPSWATQGRLYLGQLMSFRDFGRFDTTTYSRIYEVAIGSARAPETERLNADWQKAFHNIHVSRFTLRPPAKVLYDFAAQIDSAEASGYKKAKPVIIIDHWFNPRFVIPVALSRTTVSLAYKNVPLNGVLRGYGIIGYRSGRFNQGGPITVAIFVNDEKIGEQKIMNFGPQKPFRFVLQPSGLGEVRFEFKARNHPEREFGFAADIRLEPQIRGGVR